MAWGPTEPLGTDSTFVYDSYQHRTQEGIDIPPIPGSTAITVLNGLTGPTLTLAGGTSGFSYAPAGITITLTSPLTTKGDLYTRDSTNGTRLAIGTNGYVLTADSGEATGMKWAASGAVSSGDLTSAFLLMGA